VRWRRSGFFVENLFVVELETIDDILAVFEEGSKNRTVRAHDMNVESSRSHAVMTIFIDAEVPDADSGHTFTQFGKITFVDLAGSEDLRRTRQTQKIGVKETGNINRSLFTLGNVISALSDNRKREGFIPYRDSVLTKLLMDSLGGTSLCLMMACLSPATVNIEDSLSTLNYANRTKSIRNRPKVHMSASDFLVQSLRKEVSALRNENDYLQQRLVQHDIPIYGEDAAEFLPQKSTSHEPPQRCSSRDSLGSQRPVLPPIADGEPDDESTHDARFASASYGDRRSMAAEEYLKRTLAENKDLKEDVRRVNRESEELAREHDAVMKENEVLNGRIINLERIFDNQAEAAHSEESPRPPFEEHSPHSREEGARSVADGAWHDHNGLRISNKDGTMSVYKEAVWDAEVLGPGTHRSQQGSDVQVQRLQAELDAASAREQELLRAVHQLQQLANSRPPEPAPSPAPDSATKPQVVYTPKMLPAVATSGLNKPKKPSGYAARTRSRGAAGSGVQVGRVQ